MHLVMKMCSTLDARSSSSMPAPTTLPVLSLFLLELKLLVKRGP